MHILADGISRYGDFAKNKDVQMLAMLAVLILQTPYTTITAPPSRSALQRPFINVLPSSIRSPRTGSLDVSTIAQGLDQQPISPALGRQSSPVAPAFAPSLSSSTSSRGSWTNIFKPGRQFVQDTLNPTSVVSTDLSLQSDAHSMSSGSDRPRPPDSSFAPGTGHRRRKDSQSAPRPAIITSTSSATTSRSWTDNTPPLHRNRTSSGAGGGGSGSNARITFSSMGTQQGLPVTTTRPPLHPRGTGFGRSAVTGESATSGKLFVVFDPPEDVPRLVAPVFRCYLTLTWFVTWARPDTQPVFSGDFVNQLDIHVHVYAELLSRWHMYEKRITLLKTVNKRNHVQETNKGVHHQVGEQATSSS